MKVDGIIRFLLILTGPTSLASSNFYTGFSYSGLVSSKRGPTSYPEELDEWSTSESYELLSSSLSPFFINASSPYFSFTFSKNVPSLMSFPLINDDSAYFDPSLMTRFFSFLSFRFKAFFDVRTAHSNSRSFLLCKCSSVSFSLRCSTSMRISLYRSFLRS